MSRAVNRDLPKTDPVASEFLSALRQALHGPQVSDEQVAQAVSGEWRNRL